MGLVVAFAAGCAADDASLVEWCGLVADGAVVALDAADAPERWRSLESAGPRDLRTDLERLRVAAHQVAGLDPDDVEGASQLALAPRVVESHGRVVAAIEQSCNIDVATLSVVDRR